MSLGTAGAARAAAAVLGTGPYTARFGLASDPAGVVGEPTPGVGGYARPTITLSQVTNDVTVTSAITLGAMSADLGPVRAVSLHDAAGGCIACGSLEDQLSLANGVTLVLPANSIVLTFVTA